MYDIDINELGVSVIVPTYKQTKLFERAIVSLYNQTHEKFEIVVVDDNELCSNYSLKIKHIINKYESSLDIKYFKNNKNMGSAQSRNIGVMKAKYDYVTFLDDDDIYYENKIEMQIRSILHNNSLFNVCNIKLVYPNGMLDVRNRNYLKNKDKLLIQHLKYHITGTSTFMYNKEFFKSIGGFPNSDLGDEFLLMTESLLKSNRFSHCDKVLVSANINHNLGLSSSANKITSENSLIKYKKNYFSHMSFSDKNYILMRHNLVKSLAYLKMKELVKFIFYLVKAFILHPIGVLRIVTGKDR